MVDSCVRGFHVYQDIWTPTTGECLSCQTEDSNAFDPYAVAIRKSANVIGHVPQKISAACSLFIQRGGTLTCIIIDSHRQYSADLPQGGLQIPCKLEFKCDDADLLSNIKKLVRSAPPIDFELKHHTPAAVPKRKLNAKPDDPCQPPVKKQKQTKDSVAINLDQSSQSARDIAKEDPWATFGRCTLTTVDKSIILEGMVISCVIYLELISVQVSG